MKLTEIGQFPKYILMHQNRYSNRLIYLYSVSQYVLHVFKYFCVYKFFKLYIKIYKKALKVLLFAKAYNEFFLFLVL